MKINIIVDSCCDMPANIKDKHNIQNAPFTISIDGKEYIDDANLSLNELTANMFNYKNIASSPPSASIYLDCIKKDCTNFIVTLSSNLSNSYSSAIDAKQIAQNDGYDVHVFDTKSASAGQLLITLKLIKLITIGLEKEDVILLTEKYIDSVKTFASCHDLKTLIANGKISNIKRKILTALRVRPILGADSNGDIGIYGNARGNKQTVSQMIKLIKNSKKKTANETIVITHCNNLELAEKLKNKIQQLFKYKNILITQTNAVSSLYLNNKGVIIAF